MLILLLDTTAEWLGKYCHKLKECILAWNKRLTSKALKSLGRGCTNLKTLNVSYCNLITDEGVEVLPSLLDIMFLGNDAVLCKYEG